MKTHCKHTRCATPAFVRHAIGLYLKGKSGRRDVRAFLARNPDPDRLAERIADEIRTGDYRSTRIRYFNRIEPISNKHRVIGRETVRHQMYDYVAVTALMPLFKAKIGRWQTASIPGRGTIDARRAIKRWTRERSSRWFVKLDVRKYYPSIDRPTLKRMLARDVGDRTLLRLTYHLIDQYQGDNGLNIGSYLSQWLANYYLAPAYHLCEQGMFAERTNRRTGTIKRRRLITHALFYMDDILLVGRSKRDLKTAARRLAGFLKQELRLDVHPEWNCKRLDLEPIDMVGYTFRPHGRVNIRAGVFLRAQRAFNRARRRKRIGERLARRCASYYGYLRNSDSVQYRRRHRIDQTMRRAGRELGALSKENPWQTCPSYPASSRSRKSTTTRAATASPTSASDATSAPRRAATTTDPHTRNGSPRRPTS